MEDCLLSGGVFGEEKTNSVQGSTARQGSCVPSVVHFCGAEGTMDANGQPDLAPGVADAVPFHFLHALGNRSGKADRV